MILILSNHGDYSTDIVIDWLEYLEAKYVRINSFDLMDYPWDIDLSCSQIKIKGQIIDNSKIGAVWFRKFGFFRKSKQANDIKMTLDPYAQSYFSTEFSRVMEVFESFFAPAFWLTNPQKITLNKFLVLKKAVDIGLNVPKTYVTNNKNTLRFLQANGIELISKSIYDPLFLKVDSERYSMYTALLQETDMQNIPETFLPSMVQEKISKRFEIRTFYLCGKCYSMAIMSQMDTKTSLDFRKYNTENPNRFLPYKLPLQIEESVNHLMEELDLNTGSLDFILDENGQYIFLEVNPTGQFGMVDFSCNYGLHEKVAKKLLFEDLKRI
ncbi:MAG: grasp-with-spasm system ATP-grasp peptide maturase [Candidatus Symbiothrix sp.]|jgi:ATP-GRASP peptide maturase of grasp-with-spasm system|nr:grasp-with-spasm system ATP-grasp peptide maturase [Candidatus Symbiothrix sp.]